MAEQSTYHTLNNVSDGEPHLCLTNEPETKYRFRYVSEGGSHGVISGKNGKKTYPTVKLLNYHGSTENIFIRVSLCTEKRTDHVAFVFKEKGSSESRTHLDEALKEDYTAVFKDIAILSHKKEDVYQALLDKQIRSLGRSLSRTARENFEKENLEKVKKEAKEISNTVVLRFDAYEQQGSNNVQICEPLYSDRIGNQKTSSKGELKICRMSKVTGSWKGEEEVILLCEKVQKDNIKIKFFEHDVTANRWEGYGSFTKADVHHQVAIAFKTPKYKTNAKREVAVCLERDDEQSDPVYFTYLPEDCPSRKRKKCVPEETLNLLSPMDTPSCSSGISDENFEKVPLLSSLQEISQDFSDNSNSACIPQFEKPIVDLDFFFMGELGEYDLCTATEVLRDLLPENESVVDDSVDETNITEDMYSPNYNIYQNIEPIEIDVGKAVAEMSLMKLEDSVLESRNSKSILKNESSNKSLKKEEKIKKYMHLISKKDKSGNTLLHLAAMHNKSIGVVMHMNRMAHYDIVNIQNDNKQTALLIAVEKNSDAIKDLLLNGADPNIKNAEGNNCYHIACFNNLEKSISYLLTYARFPADSLNKFNNDGLTPLHLAIKNNSADCLLLLKRNDLINLSVKEKKCGRSLLHYVVEYCPHIIPDLLKEDEININIQDFEGNTPLHIACAVGNYDTVKQLLLVGADPTVKNVKQIDLNSDEESSGEEIPVGQTPADLTTNSKILDLLKQAIIKNASALQDSTVISESARTTEELVINLSKLLNPGMKWKDIALYVLDERFFGSLEDSENPTKTLVQLMKKTHGDRYIEELKMVCSMIGLDDAMEVLTNLQVSN